MNDLPAHEDLDNDDVNSMLIASLDLIRSMNALYGAEKAQELWDVIGDTLGKETKYKVFHMMLTGERPVGIADIKGPIAWRSGSNKVSAIKAIRAFTGMGLRESKEIIEEAGDKTGLTRIKTLNGKYDANARREFISNMRDAGIEVS